MPVCLFAVQLVNGYDNRLVGLLCLTDEELCSNLNSLGCVYQDDTAVANCES